MMWGGGKGSGDKVEKRAAWLNQNVFGDRPIDAEAVAAMKGLGAPRAMELFKEIETEAGKIRSPSGYLKTAAKREGLTGPAAPAMPAMPAMDWQAAQTKVHKRATWLNANVFSDRPIDDDAMAAVAGIYAGLGHERAMELFKDIETKGAEVRDPSGYLKAAAKRAGFVPPQEAMSASNGKGSKGAGAIQNYGAVQNYGSGPNFNKVHKRAKWLSENVFQGKPIDDEAIAAMASLDVGRAMEMFKEMEEKGDQIKNPSGYLKAAVKNEANGGWQGQGLKRKQPAGAPPLALANKAARVDL